jgi:hypothetical protein
MLAGPGRQGKDCRCRPFITPEARHAAHAGVPTGTLHPIAARVPAETLAAATPVTGLEGNSRSARSAADADIHPKNDDV